MKKSFPSQKKAFKNKTLNWRKSHLEWAEEFIQTENSPIRTSISHKMRAFRAYIGNLTRQDYSTVLNPNELKAIEDTLPDEIEHMPIAVSYIDVLLGEEFDRRFEWRAMVTNPDSISRIENDKKKLLKAEVQRIVEDTSISEEDSVAQLEKYIKYLYTEYQDDREIRANQLLKHFIKELDLKMKFNEGFKYVLLTNEEHYLGDIVNGRPVIEVIDSKKIEIIRAGNSNKTEDADIILLWDYWSPGQIIDRYYSFLSEKDIKKLDSTLESRSVKYNGRSDQEYAEDTINAFNSSLSSAYINVPGLEDKMTRMEPVDNFGNYRIMRLYWKSKKKILKVKSYDDEGNVKYDFYSENYIPATELGEEVEEYWVNHWWEGVQVGADIYPFIRPRSIQFNKLNDPGYNHPGIVGQTYNIAGLKSSSMMDRAIKYNLIYDVIFHNMKDAMSKYFGSLPVVDLAEIPAGWDMKKWLFFARKAGIAVKDSFKEGTKGRSLGMLAGGMSGSQNMMNQQGLGNYINEMMSLLSFIEQQMGRVIGVPPQRLGDIQNRETVGGVERAVTQSSFITNERYKIHDNVKKRVFTMLLELCKTAYKDNPTKFQNISDVFLNESFSIDDDVVEEEYGIVIDNDTNVTILEQKLDMLTQAALQNQTLNFSDVMKLYVTSSLAEKQRMIEASEKEQRKQIEAERQEELEMERQHRERIEQIEQLRVEQEQADIIRQEKEHQDKIALEQYKIDEDNLTKRLEINSKEINYQEQIELRRKELEDKLKANEEEMKLKHKDLEETRRNNRAEEAIKNKKIETDERINKTRNNKTNSKKK